MASEKLGSHDLSVTINETGVRINSELTYSNPTRPREHAIEDYASVEEAKEKLDSLYKLYNRFLNAYKLIGIFQIEIFAGSMVKTVGDALKDNDPASYSGDLLRTLAIVGLGFYTIAAGVNAKDNKTQIGNKITAVKEAQISNSAHFQNTYRI